MHYFWNKTKTRNRFRWIIVTVFFCNFYRFNLKNQARSILKKKEVPNKSGFNTKIYIRDGKNTTHDCIVSLQPTRTTLDLTHKGTLFWFFWMSTTKIVNQLYCWKMMKKYIFFSECKNREKNSYCDAFFQIFFTWSNYQK